MTTAAICGTREASCRPSFYRGEQYDSDLGLYYLCARYYNPLTGRFVSMDPEDGIITDPATLHKYLYAAGDPVNRIDPSGRAEAVAGTRGGGGALGEYGMLVLNIAVQVISSEQAMAAGIACVLNKTATLLGGLAKPGTLVSITQTLCSATVKKCRPCDPPVEAGDPGYDLHIGQKKDHFDQASQTWIPGGQTHWHLFVCNQAPPSEGCLCHWNKEREMTGVGVTPPGFDVKKFSCSGGGIY